MTKEEIKQAFADRIKKALKDQNISKKEFAQMMDINPSEVTRLLSGKHNPTTKTIFHVEYVLGIIIIKLD